eukprot:CFRG7482T1
MSQPQLRAEVKAWVNQTTQNEGPLTHNQYTALPKLLTQVNAYVTSLDAVDVLATIPEISMLLEHISYDDRVFLNLSLSSLYFKCLNNLPLNENLDVPRRLLQAVEWSHSIIESRISTSSHHTDEERPAERVASFMVVEEELHRTVDELLDCPSNTNVNEKNCNEVTGVGQVLPIKGKDWREVLSLGGDISQIDEKWSPLYKKMICFRNSGDVMKLDMLPPCGSRTIPNHCSSRNAGKAHRFAYPVVVDSLTLDHFVAYGYTKEPRSILAHTHTSSTGITLEAPLSTTQACKSTSAHVITFDYLASLPEEMLFRILSMIPEATVSYITGLVRKCLLERSTENYASVLSEFSTYRFQSCCTRSTAIHDLTMNVIGKLVNRCGMHDSLNHLLGYLHMIFRKEYNNSRARKSPIPFRDYFPVDSWPLVRAFDYPPEAITIEMVNEAGLVKYMESAKNIINAMRKSTLPYFDNRYYADSELDCPQSYSQARMLSIQFRQPWEKWCRQLLWQCGHHMHHKTPSVIELILSTIQSVVEIYILLREDHLNGKMTTVLMVVEYLFSRDIAHNVELRLDNSVVTDSNVYTLVVSFAIQEIAEFIITTGIVNGNWNGKELFLEIRRVQPLFNSIWHLLEQALSSGLNESQLRRFMFVLLRELDECVADECSYDVFRAGVIELIHHTQALKKYEETVLSRTYAS